MSSGNIVIWGAGRIGRGFIGDIFNNNGYGITYIDQAQGLVDLLNQNGTYRVVRAVSADNIKSVDINGYRALHTSEKEAIQHAFNNASITALAVYPKDFEDVARQLKMYLLGRLKHNSTPMNILLCTNLAHAGPKFSQFLYNNLDDAEKQRLEEVTGIIETLVIRICPNPPADLQKEHPLVVWTNGYNELPVDKHGFKGELPDIAEMRFVEDMRAEEMRKIYTYNMCHAVLAYHGHIAGHKLLVECIADDRIRDEALGALDEVSQMLQKKYGFTKSDMDAWIDSVITHTNNPTIGDTVVRSAADPMRKLQKDDRLIGPTMFCVEESIEPKYLINAVAAAFHYYENDDDASKQLNNLIEKVGISKAVVEVCRLPEGSYIHTKIVDAYKAMKPEIEWIARAAKAYRLGFEYEKLYHGCGQSVIAAATEVLGIFDDEVFNAATGLCGGVGLVNDASCSAFTGGVMVIGMVLPRHRDHFDSDRENKYINFELVQQLRNKFIAKYSSMMCGEIHKKIYGRAYDLRDKAEREAFEAAGGHGDHGCTEVAADVSKWTIEILSPYLMKGNNFGRN